LFFGPLGERLLSKGKEFTKNKERKNRTAATETERPALKKKAERFFKTEVGGIFR